MIGQIGPSDNFNLAFEYVIRNEGLKYTNDPKDSGGPTKFGITQSTLEDFLGYPVDDFAVQDLRIETARDIYLYKYWNPLFGDSIKDLAISTCIFDSAVLYGVGVAALMAQKAVNLCGVPTALKLDGVLGDKSLIALNGLTREVFLAAFHSLVSVRIASTIAANPKNEKFRGGWTKRADRLLSLVSYYPSTKYPKGVPV